MYRGQIPMPFDPNALPRGIPIDPSKLSCVFLPFINFSPYRHTVTQAGYKIKHFVITVCVCVPFSAAYYLPRHLAPAPGYPHPYSPYLIRSFPDTAALENRHTLFTDYITSQQMHQWPAAAMTQRSDLLRGSRDPPLTLPYSPTTRGTRAHKHTHLFTCTYYNLLTYYNLQVIING